MKGREGGEGSGGRERHREKEGEGGERRKEVQYRSDARYSERACETRLPPHANAFPSVCEHICHAISRGVFGI